MKKIAFFLFISQASFAQDKPNNLVAVVRQALEYSPRIKEQQLLINTGEIRKQILESNQKAQIFGEASYTRLDPVAKAIIPLPGNERELQFQPNNNYNTNVSVSYLLYDWGKTKANVERILLEMKQQQHAISGQKVALAYQVVSLYYGIAFLRKSIRIQEELIALLAENGKIISKRILQGDDLNINAIQNEVRGKNGQSRLIDLQSQLERQYLFLGNLIGTDAHNLVAENLALDKLDIKNEAESPYTSAFENNSELKSLKDKENILIKDVALANINGLPNLSALGAVGLRNGFQPDINPLRFNTLLGIKLTVPIYVGKKGMYQANLAKAQSEANKEAILTVKQQINREIDFVLNDLKAANQKIELSKGNIYQAEAAMKLTKVRLENGVNTPLELQQAEMAIEDAKFGQLQYQYQAIMANIELNKLMGNWFW